MVILQLAAACKHGTEGGGSHCKYLTELFVAISRMALPEPARDSIKHACVKVVYHSDQNCVGINGQKQPYIAWL